MTDLSRQSAFMPTIKCSNCGNQVEISMMGDHVCKGDNEPAASEPVPPMPDLLGGAFSSFKQNVFDKFTRAPPTVDTSAANRTFARDQLTPVSASTGSQAISPKTPMNGRLGAGSSSEDYFSPAIAGSPRRPGGYGGFLAESEPEEGEAAYGTSPNNKQSTNLLTRMNSIAPGPFEVARTRSAKKNAFSRTVSRDDNADSSDDVSRLGSSIERPGTAASSSSGRSGSIALPKMPRKNGYGGFGPPQREGEDASPQPLAFGKRSETFPDQLLKAGGNDSQIEAPMRTPSAPGLRPERSSRPSTQNGERPVMSGDRKHRPSYGIRDTSRPPPPRKSLIRPPTRDGSLSINLADEFGAGNPYHSPSISQSSSNSGYSHQSKPSNVSSNTSPARSVASRSEPRRPSNTAKMDALMNDLQNSMNDLQPGLSTAQPISIPATTNQRLAAPKPEPLQTLRPEPSSQSGRDMISESPISPRSFPIPDRLGASLPEESQSRTRSQTTSTQGSSSQHARQPSRNPRPRGNCKACQELITGKSIASADGRLTGRYHKACFVCATCREPFTSSTFYVHEDRPYCEQHYHKLNGSLCGACHKGIEGQYLEDEVPQKYHPGCFRCGDCGVVLRDGYFDVGGRSFCERDAWRRMQAAARAEQQGQMGMRPPPSRLGSSSSGLSGAGGMPPPGGIPSIREPPRGLPAGPSSNLHRPFGLPTGQRLMPGQALGRGGLGPMQKMEKRMTRLGMM